MLGLVKLQLLLWGSRFMLQHSHLCLLCNNPDYHLCAKFLLAPLGAAEVVVQLMVDLQEISVVSGNLHKFPHDSAEVPSSVVNEGGYSLGVGLHLHDQLLLLYIRGCSLGVGCL